MHSFPSHDQGITFLGFLVTLILIGFFALLILKIGPLYMEHYKVVAALEAIGRDAGLPDKPKDEILRMLERRWDIDMVERVTTKDVVITKTPEEVTVEVAYDAAANIFRNVDVVVHFDDSAEVTRH